MVLRKTPTIVSYPSPPQDSDEYVRVMVTLYHPHQSYEEVHQSMEKMREIFTAKDLIPKYNGRGVQLTKLETVRMLLHPHLNTRLWQELFEEEEI